MPSSHSRQEFCAAKGLLLCLRHAEHKVLLFECNCPRSLATSWGQTGLQTICWTTGINHIPEKTCCRLSLLKKKKERKKIRNKKNKRNAVMSNKWNALNAGEAGIKKEHYSVQGWDTYPCKYQKGLDTLQSDVLLCWAWTSWFWGEREACGGLSVLWKVVGFFLCVWFVFLGLANPCTRCGWALVMAVSSKEA